MAEMWAQPKAGTVRDHWGDPCSAAQADSYPLSAKCDKCGQPIRCLAGDADWYHRYTNRGSCDAPALTERGGENKSGLGPWTE